jgi:hypothetical protein
MSAPNDVLTGDELLAAVSDAMVAFHERYFDRGPVIAKALLLGEELLACVCSPTYSATSRRRSSICRAPPSYRRTAVLFRAMQHKFIASVEQPSGRGVQAFISNSDVDPDVEIELFMLKPTRDPIAHGRPASTTSVRGYAYAWERAPDEGSVA